MTREKRIQNLLILFGAFSTILFVGFILVSPSAYCNSTAWCQSFFREYQPYDYLFPIFFSAAPIFIISALTRLGLKGFGPWLKFSYLWLPLSLLFSIARGSSSGSWITSGYTPQGTFFFLMIIYFIISIGIVAHQTISKGRTSRL